MSESTDGPVPANPPTDAGPNAVAGAVPNGALTGAALPHPLPDLEEVLADCAVVELPMTVRFRGIRAREALLLRGPLGWAEFGAFPEYGDDEAVAWWRSALEAGWSGFPEPRRTRIPVNATVPAVPAREVARVLRGYGDGIEAVKIKVAEPGQSLEDDDARVAAVRAALPQARLRVDANAAWGVEEAVEALVRLSRHGLEYAEQPGAGIRELAQIRERLHDRGAPVLIAADESVRRAEDPLAVARAGAADLIVVKAAPLGGVRRALAVVEASGLPAVVSSAIDTSVGLRAGVALAAALPQLPYACGLGTGALLVSDVTREPLRPVGGMLPLRPVVVDRDLLAEHRVAPGRERWWRERADRVHALLSAQESRRSTRSP